MFPLRSDFDTDEDWMHEVEKAGFKYVSIPSTDNLKSQVMCALLSLYNDAEYIDDWSILDQLDQLYQFQTYAIKDCKLVWIYKWDPFMRYMSSKAALDVFSKSMENIDRVLTFARNSYVSV